MQEMMSGGVWQEHAVGARMAGKGGRIFMLVASFALKLLLPRLNDHAHEFECSRILPNGVYAVWCWCV